MTYALERLTAMKSADGLRYVWRRYAVCGNRNSLEKVRQGQDRPEDWRIVFAADAKKEGQVAA